MAHLVFEWDQSLIAPLTAKNLGGALFRAVSKAGGDAIRAARVASSRTVRFRKRMKVKKVNDGLRLRYPRTRELEGLEWRVDVSGEVVPVSAFPFRETRAGVVVSINQGKGKLFPGAFVARMKSNHVGIFTRKGKARLPIEERFTTRISDVFSDAGMVPAVYQRAQGVFAATFSRVLPMELAKAGAK